MARSKLIISSLSVIFLLVFTLSNHPLTIAADSSSSSGNILALIQKLKTDAEKQIVANHGQSSFDLFKKKFSKTYPLDKYPMPSDAYECLTLKALPQNTGSDDNLDFADQTGVYFMTGLEATMKGFPDGAKWCFANAAVLSHMCALHLSNLAFTLNLENNFEDALTLLNYAKTLDPSNSSIYVNLAYSYQGLEQYDEAIQALLTAIMLSPGIEKYHDMLLAIQNKKERSDALKKAVAEGKGGSKKSPDLNKALKMLEDNKQKEQQKDLEQELSTITSSYEQRPGRKKTPRIDADRRFGSYALSPEFFDLSSAGLPFMDFCQMAAFLNQMGNNYEKAEAPAGSQESAKKIVKMTGENMSLLFKGYAMEAAKICGDADLENDIWEGLSGLMDEMAKSHFPKKPKPKKPEKKKEKFKKKCIATICFSKGNQGTYKLSVSAAIIGGEWKYNPKTYNFGFKASIGPKIKGGFGSFTGEAGVDAYFECDLDSGPVAGVTGKATVSTPKVGPVDGKVGVQAGGKFDIEKGNIKGDVSVSGDLSAKESKTGYKKSAKTKKKLAEFTLENIYEESPKKSPYPQKNIFK
jgi:tetratricopeptide (TPR) repeat protein